MSGIKEVGATPHAKIYAKRSEVGGVVYFDDSVGGGQMVVDMTTVPLSVLQWIVSNHKDVERLLPDKPTTNGSRG